MKYVMLRHANGRLLAVMGVGENATHANLAAGFLGTVPVSAGFVRFDERGTAEVYGRSDSLCLWPHSDDARFLTAFYRTSTAGAPSLNTQKIPA